MQIRWTIPKYNKSQVDKSGDILIRESPDPTVLDNAFEIMNNWRSAHAYPMHIFKKRLGLASKKIDPDALVVQRLKRVPSIMKKLKRPQTHTMKLSQMQDIGGCRSVLSDVKLVKKLNQIYKKSRGLKHKRIREKDYIKNPKSDGYRGIHLIYKYKSDKKSTYNGLQIEIQIRSKIQHAWATAVETVDIFTKQAIKSNEGKPEWMDFFRLVSSAFAHLENENLVDNTPSEIKELKIKISEKLQSLKVFSKMQRWTSAIKVIEPRMKELHYFLLDLDVTENKEKLTITGFTKNQEKFATDRYLETEKAQGKDPNKDVVLVAADSIDELRKGYPNYFIDTTNFLEYLKTFLNIKA